MADEQYQEFNLDLERYEKMLSFLHTSADFISLPALETDPEMNEDLSKFIGKANALNHAAREAHPGLPMLRGSVLFLAVARFESYVRAQIEDLALRASRNTESFNQLPSEMRKNLQKYSALALADPKKFRIEKYANQVALNLANNINGTSKPGDINYHCISITFENMRPDTIDELFSRLSINDFWDRIGLNNKVQLLLETYQSENAKKSSKSKLNSIMDLRNKIAHSPQSVTWPSHDDVVNFIKFFKTIGSAISELIPVYEIQMKRNPPRRAEGGRDPIVTAEAQVP